MLRDWLDTTRLITIGIEIVEKAWRRMDNGPPNAHCAVHSDHSLTSQIRRVVGRAQPAHKTLERSVNGQYNPQWAGTLVIAQLGIGKTPRSHTSFMPEWVTRGTTLHSTDELVALNFNDIVTNLDDCSFRPTTDERHEVSIPIRPSSRVSFVPEQLGSCTDVFCVCQIVHC